MPPENEVENQLGMFEKQRLLTSLLSYKDVKLEHYLQDLVESELGGGGNGLQEKRQQEEDSKNKTMDELESHYIKKLGGKISTMSSVLWHRVGPIVQTLIHQTLRSTLDDQLAIVVHSEPSFINMVHNYGTLFREFIQSPILSFKTGNPNALKRIHPRDYWILQYFALATCRRSRGDQCLQIGLSGRTSVGKSTLFEAPLIEIVHQYLSDTGCGRFKLDSKPVLFFHDIDIHDIVNGKDRDLIKTLARGEPTKSKIHSSTMAIPPVHLFYTSNTKLFNHNVEWKLDSETNINNVASTNATHTHSNLNQPTQTIRLGMVSKERKKMLAAANAMGQLQIPLLFGTMHAINKNATTTTTIPSKKKKCSTQPSLFSEGYDVDGSTISKPLERKLEETSTKTTKPQCVFQKYVSEIHVHAKNIEHVSAVRARFLECFCPGKPKLSTHLFPTTGMFQRHHMICGIYNQVLDLLESTYSPSDFASLGLPLYTLCGLAKNAHIYTQLGKFNYYHQEQDQQEQDTKPHCIPTFEALTFRLKVLAITYFPPTTHPQEYTSIINMLGNCNNDKKEDTKCI